MDARAWSVDDSLPARPQINDTSARDRQWFFGHENRPAGPVDESQMRELVLRGEVGPSTMVWADGMRRWVTVEQVREFCPDRDTAVSASELGAWSSVVRPARRALARTIDSIGPVLAGVVAGILLASEEAVPLLLSEIVCVLLGLFFASLLEAFSLARFGSTPGKSLLSLRVRTSRGSLPPLRSALERSLSVWAFGLACGVPLLMPITVVRARAALLRRGRTSWDHATGSVVEERPVRGSRLMLSFAALCAVSILIGLLLRLPRA